MQMSRCQHTRYLGTVGELQNKYNILPDEKFLTQLSNYHQLNLSHSREINEFGV